MSSSVGPALIHDRDPLYTKEFLGIVAGSGIKAIKLPRQGHRI
jgi:hypothetical protein